MRGFRDVRPLRDVKENLPYPGIGPTTKAFENARNSCKGHPDLPREIGFDELEGLPKEITKEDLH